MDISSLYRFRSRIQNQIWNMIDIIKVETTDAGDFYFVLFLASLYKDGIITSEDISFKENQFFYSLKESIAKSKHHFTKEYIIICETFRPLLKTISSRLIDSLLDRLFQIDKFYLKDDFPTIFNNVLLRTSRALSFSSGENIQLSELTLVVLYLSNLRDRGRIFNPFAGFASFGVYYGQNLNKHPRYGYGEAFPGDNKTIDYFGQEVNSKTWAWGLLYLMAYERLDTFKYVCEDPILNWPEESEKFDLVVVNPPLDFKFNEKHLAIDPEIDSLEHFILKNGVQSLNKEGRLIAILKQDFLYADRYSELRKILVEEDLIDTIISLPSGSLQKTAIPLVILVISKSKKRIGSIRFIKGRKYGRTGRSFPSNPKANAGLSPLFLDLTEKLSKGYQDSESIRVIDSQEAKDSNYNLNVSRYFINKNIEGTRLKDILDLVFDYYKKYTFPENGRLVQFKDLKDDKIGFKLNLQTIEEAKISRRGIERMDDSCLLLSLRGISLKPTYFEYIDTPVFVKRNLIIPFKINEELAYPQYLINELFADYVQEQLNCYREGNIVPSISIDDLLSVVIKLPSLAEQKAKVEGVLEQIEETKKFKKERDTLLQDQVENSFNEFASLKHTLGRPRTIILGWADNIYAFFEENYEEIASLNKSFEDFYGRDLFFAFKDIKNELNFMTLVLQKGEKGLDVDKFEITPIPLSEIKDLINNFSNNKLNFKIKKIFIDRISNIENLETLGISANKELLKILIDNLLANADKHAFDKNSQNNEVFFELSDNGVGILVLQIGNNGKPFPKNYNREKFTTKYSTANSEKGSGLGGYDIHRIATKLDNPNWELILNEDPIYPVIFEFQFPIQIIK